MDLTSIKNFDVETLHAMRAWVCDCAPNPDALDFAEHEATDEQIVNYVRRQYDGGVRAFLEAL